MTKLEYIKDICIKTLKELEENKTEMSLDLKESALNLIELKAITKEWYENVICPMYKI